MFRTEKSVRLLQAVAAIASLAVLFWSLGLPSLRFAEAENLTDVSDTLSDTASSTVANHTIEFVSPTGVANGETIEITFDSGFNLSQVGEEDIDLLINDVNRTNADWSTATTSTTITITIDTGVIAADATTTILIGLHATNEGSPNSQIVNPATNGPKDIEISAGSQDTGATIVVILDTVYISASVDTLFTFTVSGLGGGETVNGTTTTGTTTATSIPFGKLESGVGTTTAQRLSVVTNASNGWVVTVQVDHTLQSSTGADIDLFDDGVESDTPAPFTRPAATVGDENTYGHWAVTSEDTETFSRSTEFGLDEWIAASTTPRVVMGHNSVSDGTASGTTDVGFHVEISSLQEAGDDYEAILTYVATPTF
jgi:hypothetical protein